jgi:polygalacturonase
MKHTARLIWPALFAAVLAPAQQRSFAPGPDDRQVPRAMHVDMPDRPVIRVGQRDADIVGSDNRALQAAVDYVGSLGGGTVEIGEGVYLMRDSLHLRSHVTVRGMGAKTILRKAPSAQSMLALDGDYGEEQITVRDAGGFQVGDSVAVWDSTAGGFYTTVARITGKKGNSFSIDRPLNADCTLPNKAQAATVFPVISGYHIEGAVIERLTVDGAREKNIFLNGCRGGGIFLYRAFGTIIRDCYVRDYNGDGISFQQSNDVRVERCTSENNAGLGIHPGSGSQRPVVRENISRRNGQDGLFLCWRVKDGIFESNQLLDNDRHGISIGHKDTDNLLRQNVVTGNGHNGVYFRNESEGMAGNRNTLEDNRIEGNGRIEPSAGIAIDGVTTGTVIRNNTINDGKGGIRIGKRAGEVTIEKNKIQAPSTVEDQRR